MNVLLTQSPKAEPDRETQEGEEGVEVVGDPISDHCSSIGKRTASGRPGAWRQLSLRVGH
jgi:hypothetical protein